MKNKNRIFRVSALLLVLCFISTVMISGTFAKYTSTYAGQDTALVARWSLTSTSFTGETVAGIYDLPIWDHDYTTNIYEKDGDNYLIAPGIKGSFGVQFSYDADVDADLTFKFTKSGDASDTVPIQYSIDNFTTIYYDLDELADAIIGKAESDSTSTITGSDGTYVVTNTATAKGENPAGPILVDETVSWKWPYNVSEHDTAKLASADFVGSGYGGAWTDANDTAIGNASQPAGLTRDSYVLKLEIAATQKTPGPEN